MGYLVARPDFETVTRIGAAFFKKFILDPAAEAGIPVWDLYGDLANPQAFWEEIKNPDVNIVTGCGHGDPDTFTGQDYSVLIKTSSYDPELIKDKWISHLSCSTGKRLGPDLVAKGAAGFKGYKDVYYFYADTNVPDPTEDIYAFSFLRPDTIRHEWLIEGKTPEETDVTAKEYYALWASFWDDRDPEIAAVIRYDMSIMVMLTPAPPPPTYCWLPPFWRRLFRCPY